METLINTIENDHQREILYKQLVLRQEASQIYLCGWEPHPGTKNTYGSVTLLGTYNHSKQKREAYDVKVYKPGNKCSFWCSCSYMKFKSSKEKTVCKHICFLLCKVARIFKPEFYESKILESSDMELLISKLEGMDLWNDNALVRKITKLRLDDFHNSTKDLDLCPICYDDMTQKEINCPRCACNVHEKCMDVWLERQQTCVYCRSDIWKYYGHVKNGITVNIV